MIQFWRTGQQTLHFWQTLIAQFGAARRIHAQHHVNAVATLGNLLGSDWAQWSSEITENLLIEWRCLHCFLIRRASIRFGFAFFLYFLGRNLLLGSVRFYNLFNKFASFRTLVWGRSLSIFLCCFSEKSGMIGSAESLRASIFPKMQIIVLIYFI